MGGAGVRPAPQSFGKEALVVFSVWRFVVNFAEDEQGQDLVEYALLGAFVAIATVLGLKAIEGGIKTRYGIWDTDEQNLWRPPNP